MTHSIHELANIPHRRYNLLTGEWVLVSPHRTQRPWLGHADQITRETRPTYDPECYLCPGNTRFVGGGGGGGGGGGRGGGGSGAQNPEYTETFVFDNDFPSLYSPLPDIAVDDAGLLVARAESGTCRVICFSPRHDQSLASMEVDAIRRVVDVWAQQYQELGARDDIGHVQIFENKGESMGASNPHPHCQIWAQRSVPLTAQREVDRAHEHYERHGRTLLSDYLGLEIERQERVVCANDGFVALVPFWAVWPFETIIISRRPVPHLAALNDAERRQLAGIIKQLTAIYDELFDVPFPYSSGIHQAPTDGTPHNEYHLHLHFYPPLLRSATVRKFLVGYEMLGEPQRDLTPEGAAARLRDVMSALK